MKPTRTTRTLGALIGYGILTAAVLTVIAVITALTALLAQIAGLR